MILFDVTGNIRENVAAAAWLACCALPLCCPSHVTRMDYVSRAINRLYKAERTEENTQRARQFHLALYMTKISSSSSAVCAPSWETEFNCQTQTNEEEKEEAEAEEADIEEASAKVGVDMEASQRLGKIIDMGAQPQPWAQTARL